MITTTNPVSGVYRWLASGPPTTRGRIRARWTADISATDMSDVDFGDVLVFSSGHFLRVLAARWLGLAAENARHFLLGTTGYGELGYEHTVDQTAVHLWNDTSHVGE